MAGVTSRIQVERRNGQGRGVGWIWRHGLSKATSPARSISYHWIESLRYRRPLAPSCWRSVSLFEPFWFYCYGVLCSGWKLQYEWEWVRHPRRFDLFLLVVATGEVPSSAVNYRLCSTEGVLSNFLSRSFQHLLKLGLNSHTGFNSIHLTRLGIMLQQNRRCFLNCWNLIVINPFNQRSWIKHWINLQLQISPWQEQGEFKLDYAYYFQ